MIEFYPMIKLVHIGTAVTSGGLFALRGTASLAGMRWPMFATVRYLNYSIDTVLLTAAMMLLTILPGGLFANGWLTVKIGFLLAYITLGILALRRNLSRLSRTLLFVSALLAYGQIYAIARAHHPLGALYLLG